MDENKYSNETHSTFMERGFSLVAEALALESSASWQLAAQKYEAAISSFSTCLPTIVEPRTRNLVISYCEQYRTRSRELTMILSLPPLPQTIVGSKQTSLPPTSGSASFPVDTINVALKNAIEHDEKFHKLDIKTVDVALYAQRKEEVIALYFEAADLIKADKAKDGRTKLSMVIGRIEDLRKDPIGSSAKCGGSVGLAGQTQSRKLPDKAPPVASAPKRLHLPPAGTRPF